MNISKKYLFSLIMLFICFNQLNAEIGQSRSLAEVVANFTQQVKLLPQEKIYIQTDKNYYLSGENIFFRAHLVDAMYHIPVHASRYVYVELIDVRDSVISRLRIRPEEKMYFGNIKLPQNLPDGAYKIRSYTNFMRNMDETYFFSKIIFIADPNSAKIETETNFQIEQGTKIYMNLRLKDLNPEPIQFPDEILLRVNNGKPKKTKQDSGYYKLSFEMPANNKQRVVLLETQYRGYTYKKFIRVPYPEDMYHVSFFPEGGSLLEGSICSVGFKAVASDGMHENITGDVFDDDGKLVTEISSSHLGMGVFQLNPLKNKTYYAVCKNEKGIQLKFELPKVKKSTYALKVNSLKGQLWVALNKAALSDAETLYLIAHFRGEVLYADSVRNINTPFVFDKKEFPTGILHFILLNNNFKPISERLVFINNNDKVKINFTLDKISYKSREHVIAKLNLSADTILQNGNFSVAVTDDGEVWQDTCSNVLTNLLLTSELRGYVESPASYFDKQDRKSDLKLDMLMMTQGWRRYNVTQALEGRFTLPQYNVEVSQALTGKVQGGLLLGGVEQAQVSAVSVDKVFMQQTETNKDGKFIFQNFELPDSSMVMLQALSKNGNNRMVLTVDKDTFPKISPWISPNQSMPKDVLFKYIRKEEQKYIYENGMRLVNLDDVQVLAKRKILSRSQYTAYADNSLSTTDFGNAAGLTVKKLLERIGGVTVNSSGQVYLRGNQVELLLVNDVETDLEFLDDIEAEDVLQIDVLRSSSLFGMKSANGAISITTKSLDGISSKKRFNMQSVMPLGYHKSIEFYAPIYDTEEKKQNVTPDLRTTIFWQPNVKIDATGNAVFDFYTADNPTNYTITIEGVSSEGKIIFHQGKMKNE